MSSSRPAGGAAFVIDAMRDGLHAILDVTIVYPDGRPGMLDLFGNPHLDATWAAYEEASAQLPDRWRELVDLHQVHPLLVHTALFGGGYAGRAMAAVRRYR